jgi:hypothetical protein
MRLGKERGSREGKDKGGSRAGDGEGRRRGQGRKAKAVVVGDVAGDESELFLCAFFFDDTAGLTPDLNRHAQIWCLWADINRRNRTYSDIKMGRPR